MATKRERRKQAATARFWSGKYAAATSSTARMRVAFDEARARIEDLPDDERDKARREIAKLLRQWRR